MAIQLFPMTLKSAEMITPNVKHLSLTREDGAALPFIPGQFITIHFTLDDKTVRRSYSIASIPGQTDTTDFAISYLKGGFASEYLFNMEPGATLNVAGPFGRLILKDEQPKRYILVATGTGITPYRSMLPEIEKRLAADPNLEITIMAGVQTRKDALYTEDFVHFADKNPRLHFNIFYSRETLSSPESYERTGHVQNGFDELALTPETDLIYLCGNPNMIDSSVLITKELGFPIQQVRREKYVS